MQRYSAQHLVTPQNLIHPMDVLMRMPSLFGNGYQRYSAGLNTFLIQNGKHETPIFHLTGHPISLSHGEIPLFFLRQRQQISHMQTRTIILSMILSKIAMDLLLSETRLRIMFLSQAWLFVWMRIWSNEAMSLMRILPQ